MTGNAPPTDPAVLLQMASVWQQDGKVREAEEAYRRVLALDPSCADAMNHLALIHHDHGNRDQAVKLLRAAIKLNPAARFYTNLGVVLGAMGDRTGSVAAYREACARNPKSIAAWPGVIFAMDLHPYAAPAVRLADRRAFNAQHCAALTASAPPHENDPDPSRKLRVGYLSADFRSHSAAMVFGPVLEHHDHDAFEVTCYWQKEAEPDRITERFQAAADRWRVVDELSDEQLAATIREDEIDILVDLSGYSNGHRIPVLARKPAPIVMTAWGHVTGIGIDAVDYIVADALTVPPEHEDRYHERILRLPCILAYDPHLDELPPIVPPPAEQHGYVTFGYLGRANKTGEDVWAAWAAILHRVPHSRLLLKGGDYRDETIRARITDFFISLRISAHRLEFRGPTPHEHHLLAHSDLDVALDPFPQGGGVTTLEACLMGVPSVAMLGDYLNARIAPSILRQVGMGHCIAEDVPEYVDTAVRMAHSHWTLRDRMDLRERLQRSILMDGPAYTRQVEEQYRVAWRRWCSKRTNSPDVAAGLNPAPALATPEPVAV